MKEGPTPSIDNSVSDDKASSNLTALSARKGAARRRSVLAAMVVWLAYGGLAWHNSRLEDDIVSSAGLNNVYSLIGDPEHRWERVETVPSFPSWADGYSSEVWIPNHQRYRLRFPYAGPRGTEFDSVGIGPGFHVVDYRPAEKARNVGDRCYLDGRLLRSDGVSEGPLEPAAHPYHRDRDAPHPVHRTPMVIVKD